MADRKSKRSSGKPRHELPPPELVVVVKPEAGLRVGAEGITAEAVNAAPLAKAIGAADAELRPLFGASEQHLRSEAAAIGAETGATPPDLSVYYRAEGAKDPSALARKLAGLDFVETAYVKPPAEPPHLWSELTPLAEEPPSTTPDFTSRQGYLDPAPNGVDARYAWTLPGGDGAGIRIIDVEGAWRFTHEDLLENQGGVIGGTMSADSAWRNHGTSVAGEIGGDKNAFGVTGISPAANMRAISIFGPGMGSGQAIRQAANALGAGDIILIELHRPGPRYDFEARLDQLGYIAIEWWPDDFDAILYATSRGVIVVEAAGNGAENLDDSLYETPAPGFPSSWTNPFNRANRDSGAIVVGAGAPPPGTHGRDHGPDRSRLGFSNYGAVIDAQGWGREVTTCGYGDLQGGLNEDMWYTDVFSGTSSASPIIVGTLACLQGAVRARGRTLTPPDCRGDLRATGSPQQPSSTAPVTQRIGNRPDLRALIARALPKRKLEGKEKLEKREWKEKVEKVEHKEKLEKLERKEKIEKVEVKEKVEKVEGESKQWIKDKEGKGEVEVLQQFEGKLEAERGQGIDVEQGLRGTRPFEGERSGGLEERVSRLEWALSHFIDSELRPDLGEGALSNEPDIAKLEREAADSKQAKDLKDVEKLREV